MRAFQLFAKLTIYYGAVAAILLVALMLFPAFNQFLPFGGVEALMSGPRPTLETTPVNPPHVGNLGQSAAWLIVTISGALLTALPVSWVYIAVRNREDYDQSLVDTIVVLPIVVTSIVIIVQNSLALAFSIAGIAAAVRFRNSLKSSGDALFILLAVGVGLAAGIRALELAIVMSVAFNYVLLALWFSDYGERQGMKRRFMDECEPAEEPAPTAERRRPGTRTRTAKRSPTTVK